jgi:general stress protein 26
MSDKSDVLSFLRSQSLCVVSTVNSEKHPQSALVAFAETDDLKIVFQTFVGTRKLQNIEQNACVSVVVGVDVSSYETLQYEGIAEIPSSKEAAKYREVLLKKKTPSTKKYVNDPRSNIVLIRPTWLRFSDYTGREPDIFEQRFSR